MADQLHFPPISTQRRKTGPNENGTAFLHQDSNLKLTQIILICILSLLFCFLFCGVGFSKWVDNDVELNVLGCRVDILLIRDKL